MKVSILFWALVGVLVLVGVAFLLATRATSSRPGQMSHADLLAFADRMDCKLVLLERQYDSIRTAASATQQADSSYFRVEEQLRRCRVLADSTRQVRVADGKSLLDRLGEAYCEAKEGLDALGGRPAGPGK